jgi:ribosomal protein L29
MTNEVETLETQIKSVEAELLERRANLPAHSIKPHQIIILEELEDKLDELNKNLIKLKG